MGASQRYKCVACGAAVQLLLHGIERSCDCPADTGIAAACSATVYGEGRAADDAPVAAG